MEDRNGDVEIHRHGHPIKTTNGGWHAAIFIISELFLNKIFFLYCLDFLYFIKILHIRTNLKILTEIILSKFYLFSD
jgi:hypothetical protein